MLINTYKQILILLIFIIVFILFIRCMMYVSNQQNISTSIYQQKQLENFDCTLNLTDIDPRQVSNYMKYDNTKSQCGVCNKSMLHINVASTCPTDANGSPHMESCIQKANITSSYGVPISYNKKVNIDSVKQFFCPAEPSNDIIT